MLEKSPESLPKCFKYLVGFISIIKMDCNMFLSKIWFLVFGFSGVREKSINAGPTEKGGLCLFVRIKNDGLLFVVKLKKGRHLIASVDEKGRSFWIRSHMRGYG